MQNTRREQLSLVETSGVYGRQVDESVGWMVTWLIIGNRGGQTFLFRARHLHILKAGWVAAAPSECAGLCVCVV